MSPTNGQFNAFYNKRNSFVLSSEQALNESLSKILYLQHNQEKLNDEIQKIHLQLEINSLKIAQNLNQLNNRLNKSLPSHQNSPRLNQSQSNFFSFNNNNASLNSSRNFLAESSAASNDFVSNKFNQTPFQVSQIKRFVPLNEQMNYNKFYESSLREQQFHQQQQQQLYQNESYLRSFNNLRDLSTSQTSFNHFLNNEQMNSNLNSPLYNNGLRSAAVQQSQIRAEQSFTPPLTQSSSLMSINSTSALNNIDRQVIYLKLGFFQD